MRLQIEGTFDQLSRNVAAYGSPLLNLKLVWPGGRTQTVIVEITKNQFEALYEQMPALRQLCTYTWWSENGVKDYMEVVGGQGDLIVKTEEMR